MNGDPMLKTHIPFSIARKRIFESIVQNGMNTLYATVIADRIVSKIPYHYRFFRIKDEEKLIRNVYIKSQEILLSSRLNFKSNFQIMLFLLLMVARLVSHKPSKKAPRRNFTFTFGLPQINLSMPLNQFHKFLNQKRFKHLLEGRLVVIENRKKSPFKDSRFKNTIQTFDIYLYMYKGLPTYRAKLQILCLSLRRLLVILTSKNSSYNLIAIEYVIQDPIWIVARNFYGQVETIATQSNFFKLPMIFYHAECCGIKTNMFWYSANSIPLPLKDSKMAFDTSYLIQNYVQKHFVWNGISASLVRRYNSDCDIEICGSILFYTRTQQVSNRTRSNKINVVVFDVTPFSNLQIPVLYTDKMVTRFLKDISELLIHNKKSFDINLLFKNKRVVVNNLFKKSAYPIGEKYSAMLDEMKNMDEIDFLKSSLNLYDSIGECDLVLGLPFTSPVFIGQELGVPSAFYIPEINTDFKVPTLVSEVEVLMGKKQLQRFFSEHIYN